jgi:hypothetical protein
MEGSDRADIDDGVDIDDPDGVCDIDGGCDIDEVGEEVVGVLDDTMA